MKEPTIYGKRKRKRLEREYDEYSQSTMPYILCNRYSVRFARDFHDRAITCIDLANIYLLNGFIDEAIIYLRCGITDICRSKKIYEKLDSNPNYIQKCDKIKRLFTQHVKCLVKEKSIRSFVKDNPLKDMPDSSFHTPERTSKVIESPTYSPEKKKKPSTASQSSMPRLSLFNTSSTDDYNEPADLFLYDH